MNRRRARRRNLAVIILALILLALAMLLYLRYTPFMRAAAENVVINYASSAITDAVSEEICNSGVDYSKIMVLDKDVNGNITALQTNMPLMNSLKFSCMDILGELLVGIDLTEVSLPIGSIILPEFFAGSGPKLPIHVLSLNTTEGEFISSFSDAGMNQTIHQIILQVRVNLTILTPSGTQEIEVSSDVPVAQTIIVGTVPNSLFTIE